MVKVIGAVSEGKNHQNAVQAELFGWSKINYKARIAYIATHNLAFVNPYKWSPGVEKKVVASLQKNRGYNTKTWRLKKSSVGYYYAQEKVNGIWYNAVYINCKIGYDHG
ncbi:hypothetical protein [Kurthia sibirica]|uniref:Uncharacterized protein n=1 Tax=Kurthia sibirica TaxID=202750 RepID=A0A2U3AH21_9BACL|nr:hypothetical protein [Kurthia sibirica]PWI23862.1 hypothetical protein DEX24_15455 [Kurthia sibirica]GEK35064.1 hypothetical protein KSI01_25970 [Kurthia sibirica]